MERRNWSLKVLNELQYIYTLDDEQRVKSLEKWVQTYLQESDFLEKLQLSVYELDNFSELFYKNIQFLKEQKNLLQDKLQENDKIKKFFS